MASKKYRVGDWVEVHSLQDIVRTLDANGCLDGMPFMPEMAKFCGQRFRVHKRAHKACDTVFPVRSRRVDDAVHLETRCDGAEHGGCQAGCLLYWKGAWLKPVDASSFGVPVHAVRAEFSKAEDESNGYQIELSKLRSGVVVRVNEGSTIYRCQATQLPYATRHLAWWDVRQYVEDLTSGNIGLWRLFCGTIYSWFWNISNLRIGIGRPMRWFYNTFHWLWGSSKFPRKTGIIPIGAPTPTEELAIQPGDTVRVKSHEEVLRTLNVDSRNRGLGWDAELVPYCGGTYKVLKRVTKIIDEKTGVMLEMKNPCIILDSVICEGRYSYCRMFCPRGIYPYFREIWLERVPK